MLSTRREFAKIALASLPVALGHPTRLSALTQARPNSAFSGVQVGVITYSYRSMSDQSAEATLRYILDSGINAVELMDGPVEHFLGRPAGAGRGGFGGGRTGGGRRGGGGTGNGAAGPTPYEQLLAGTMPTCAPGEGRRGFPGGFPGGFGGRGGRSTEAADQLRQWRLSVSLERVRALRQMYNDAGVTIYAYKADDLPKNAQTTDAELDYQFSVAAALGATHTTMELPSPGVEGTALLRRMAQFAEKHQIPVAYHAHEQSSLTAFDDALAMSRWNMLNVDLGHHVAVGNKGGTPIQFLEKHHARIASFHLKDRTLPEHCALTTPFGLGDAGIRDILLLVKKNRWTFPATIELEWPVPADSDAVSEVRKAVDYARSVLMA